LSLSQTSKESLSFKKEKQDSVMTEMEGNENSLNAPEPCPQLDALDSPKY
jgi:hypothetical protein